eukprot:9991793-Alexandrium_andersonii.AAC.1
MPTTTGLNAATMNAVAKEMLESAGKVPPRKPPKEPKPNQDGGKPDDATTEQTPMTPVEKAEGALPN